MLSAIFWLKGSSYFEVFIGNLQARASTWSNYKHKNTVKIMIGILPQGIVDLFLKPGEAAEVTNTLLNIAEF